MIVFMYIFILIWVMNRIEENKGAVFQPTLDGSVEREIVILNILIQIMSHRTQILDSYNAVEINYYYFCPKCLTSMILFSPYT